MQSIPNPFLEDVYVRGLSEPALGAIFDDQTVESIHGDQLRRLAGHVAHLGGGAGRVILLRSSRAGFGKSQLLSRLVTARGADCFFVPLEASRDSRPSWVGMLQGVLGACAQERLAAPRISFLDGLGRRLMGEGVADLILRGDVPAADPAGAIAMLKRDYLRAFDVRSGGSEVARWMMGNLNALLPLLGEVLGSRAVVEADEAAAWLRVLVRFNAGDAADRKAALASVAMFGDEAAAQAGAKQRLRSFCRLAALERPLVLVFDHVDALFGTKKDAMQLACMIGEMGRLQFGNGTILSVNGDVWGSCFGEHLPGALEDRLTGREVKLVGIGAGEAEELVRSRLRGVGLEATEVESLLLELKLPNVMDRRWGGAAAPREILRHAAAVWDRVVNSAGSAEAVDGPGSGGSVRDYLSGEMPPAESLAEQTTLRPMREVVRGDTPDPAEPGALDPGAVRQMGNISSLLRELKSRREQFVPPGTGTGDGANPASMPDVGVNDSVDERSPLEQRFDEIRESLLQKRGQRLDLEALRRMVSLAGDSFPVVESSDFKMSPGEEPMVTKWVFPGNEILFGFEPEHQFRYWQSLIKLAGRRVGSAAAERLKLVVFSESEHPFSGAASLDEEELEIARDNYLDVIDLDAGMMASVTAADRVVCEIAKADEPVLPADAIRELAPQLDPLWRRITRPLVAEPGESEKAV